jgi:hypothetical protein
MRFFAFSSILLALIHIGFAQDVDAGDTPLSTAQTQNIQGLADVYHIDPTRAVDRYKTVLSRDFLTALEAVDFFAQRNAYEILALAVPHMDKSVKGTAIGAIVKKRDFSSTACQILLTELQRLITSETENDEENTGNEVMEREIATALARWLGLPNPKIAARHDKSGPAYRAFVESAERKAATMTKSSPY